MSTQGSNEAVAETPQQTPPPAAPQAAAPEAKPKSFTERFLEMEATLEKIAFILQFQSQAIRGLVEDNHATREDLDGLQAMRETIAATLSLLKKSSVNIGIHEVISEIKTLRTEATKTAVAKELADGLIQETEAIENEVNLVTFSTETVEYGYAVVGSLLNDELKTQDLIGKKQGETVGGVKILNVYKTTQPQTEAKDEPKVAQ